MPVFSGGYFAYSRQYIEQLPIHVPNLHRFQERQLHDQIVVLVQSLLLLTERCTNERTPYGKALCQRQIEATDRQLDKLVYELYGLSDDEIALVEHSTDKTAVVSKT